nr:MAG TPA: Ftsk gamma domain [Caudoviricetes sp.]
MTPKFKGVFIPAKFLYSEKLNAQEKLLVADISCFTDYYKSNASIGKILGVSAIRAGKIITSLVNRGVITRMVERTPTGQVIARTLSVRAGFDPMPDYDYPPVENDGTPPVENDRTLPSEMTGPPVGNDGTPPVRNDRTLPSEMTSKNTYIDNTIEITTEKTIESRNVPAANPQKAQKRFTPPTVEEVQAYCREKNYTFEPDAFVAFYESNGWKVGKNPMKNWKAACRTWQQREKERHTRMANRRPSNSPEEMEAFRDGVADAAANGFWHG